MFCIARLQYENTVNTVNSMNITNIANVVTFNAMRYKKQYNDSPQVLVGRRTRNHSVRLTWFDNVLQYTEVAESNVLQYIVKPTLAIPREYGCRAFLQAEL